MEIDTPKLAQKRDDPLRGRLTLVIKRQHQTPKFQTEVPVERPAAERRRYGHPANAAIPMIADHPRPDRQILHHKACLRIPMIPGGYAARTGQAEILVDDHDALGRPAQFTRPAVERVLPLGRFAVVLHLRGARLAQINDAQPGQVSGRDFAHLSVRPVPLAASA